MQHELVSLNFFHYNFQVKLIWKFCSTDIVCGTGQVCSPNLPLINISVTKKKKKINTDFFKKRLMNSALK